MERSRFLDRFFCAVSVTVISFGEETLKFMKRVFFNETYYGRCRKLAGLSLSSPRLAVGFFLLSLTRTLTRHLIMVCPGCLVVCSYLPQRLMTFNVLLEIGILSFSDCLSSVFSAVRFLNLSRNVPIRAPLFFDGKGIWEQWKRKSSGLRPLSSKK